MSDRDEDASLPSWHDNPIYGMHWRSADPDRGLWRSELVLDIDYILEWVPSGDGCVKFRTAPAILIFHDAADLEISLDSRAGDGYRRYLNELSIHHIGRQRVDGEPAYYRWRIDLNAPAGGVLRFGAARFSQILTAAPLLCGEQRYPGDQRPPFTLAALP